MSAVCAYPPLAHNDSTRLLEVSRFDLPRGQLYGCLSSVRLSDRPKYCAISYAWGKGSRTKRIVLSEGYTLLVSKTVFDGLSETTRDSEVKMFWVDQICIRQDDKREKEMQVALMAQIYGQAYLVVGWLGNPVRKTRLGFRLLELFAAVENVTLGIDEGSKTKEYLRILQGLVEELCLKEPLEILTDLENAAWQGAFALVERQWFNRVWVVQEVALSSNLRIYCGRLRISGDDFCSALKLINEIVSFPPFHLMKSFSNALQLANLRRSIRAGESHNFLHLAHSLSHWDCADQRDRLNALVNVAFKGNPSPWFSANYHINVEGLYQNFAEAYISATGNLDILHFAGDSKAIISEEAGRVQVYNIQFTNDELNAAATWSPNWKIRTRPLPLHLENSVDGDLGFSATHSSPDFQIDSPRRRLQLRALLTDEVKFVGIPLVPDLPAMDGATFKVEGIFNLWYALAFSICGQDADWRYRFAMTLIADGRTAAAQSVVGTLTRAQQMNRFECWAKRLIHVYSREEDCTEEALYHYLNPISDGISEASKYGYEVLKVCKFRTFFITKHGRFGLGPAQTASGSSIYLIHGLKTPFILERRAEENCFHLRGECYVNGLMDGAAHESDRDTSIFLC